MRIERTGVPERLAVALNDELQQMEWVRQDGLALGIHFPTIADSIQGWLNPIGTDAML